MLTFWSIWLLVSAINPFNLYEVRATTYILFVVFLISFSIGFLLLAKNTNVINNKFQFLSKKPSITSLIINVGTFLSLIYFSIKYNRILTTMGVLDARNIKFELGLLFSSNNEYLFFNVIIAAIVYISFIISIITYINTKKISVLLILSMVNLYMYATIGLGRLAIFEATIIVLLAVIFSRIFRISNSSIKGKIVLVLVTLGGIGSIFSITSRRLGTNLAEQGLTETIMFTLEQGIIYFVGPISAFNQFLVTDVTRSVGHTYGRATVGGLDYLFSLLFSYMNYPFDSANDITASFTKPTIDIGSQQGFNAFYSALMNFYIDFGALGVIALSFLFGLLLAVTWNMYIVNGNVYTLSLLIYMSYTAIVSQYIFPFQSLSVWLIVLIFVVLIKLQKGFSPRYSSAVINKL